MRICLIENQWRIEEFRVLTTACLDRGHEVLRLRREVHLDQPQIRQLLMREKLDLVISADWFGSFGFDPPSGLDLPGSPPIIDLAFGSLFMELVNIAEAVGPPQTYLARQNIFLGVPCDRELARLRACGIDNALLLPFGTTDGYRCDPAHGLDQYGWLRPDQLTTRITMPELIANSLESRPGGLADITCDGVLFLGNPGQDDAPRFAGLRQAFAARVDDLANWSPDEMRAEIQRHLPQIALPLPGAVTADIWHERQIDSLIHDAKARRRRLDMTALSRHLGSRLHLFGSLWRPFGLPARPDEAGQRGQRYALAALSIDFGSLSFDCSLYNRPREILECGGRLFQQHGYDADPVWGDLAPQMTFATVAQMCDGIDRLLSDPVARQAIGTHTARRLVENFAYRDLLATALNPIMRF